MWIYTESENTEIDEEEKDGEVSGDEDEDGEDGQSSSSDDGEELNAELVEEILSAADQDQHAVPMACEHVQREILTFLWCAADLKNEIKSDHYELLTCLDNVCVLEDGILGIFFSCGIQGLVYFGGQFRRKQMIRPFFCLVEADSP